MTSGVPVCLRSMHVCLQPVPCLVRQRELTLQVIPKCLPWWYNHQSLTQGSTCRNPSTRAKKLTFESTAADLVVLAEVGSANVVRRDIPVCKGFIMAIDEVLLPYQPPATGAATPASDPAAADTTSPVATPAAADTTSPVTTPTAGTGTPSSSTAGLPGDSTPTFVPDPFTDLPSAFSGFTFPDSFPISGAGPFFPSSFTG